jgi:hypothetical protein
VSVHDATPHTGPPNDWLSNPGDGPVFDLLLARSRHTNPARVPSNQMLDQGSIIWFSGITRCEKVSSSDYFRQEHYANKKISAAMI